MCKWTLAACTCSNQVKMCCPAVLAQGALASSWWKNRHWTLNWKGWQSWRYAAFYSVKSDDDDGQPIPRRLSLLVHIACTTLRIQSTTCASLVGEKVVRPKPDQPDRFLRACNTSMSHKYTAQPPSLMILILDSTTRQVSSEWRSSSSPITHDLNCR